MSLKNILSLKKYAFLKQSIDSNVLLTPLSQQIKQNIANEWIKCNRRLPSIELFVNPLLPHSDPMTTTQLNSLKNNYNNYYRVWSEGSHQLIGIIDKFVSLRDNKVKSFVDSNKSDGLVFTLFCPKKQSLYWFQKIQGIHNHWYRNLTKSPLTSQFCAQSHQNSMEWSLSHKIEEIDQKVEEIHYYCDSMAEKKFGITDCDVISCHMDLDNSLLSFLCDGFSFKSYKNGNKTKKMKINYSLVPFKIAFTFRDSQKINDKMIEITKYLIETLKKFEIPVLPFTPKKLVPIESYDELGIPYTAIIGEESTRNGVIALRNRDSDTEEMIHISNFQKTICLYLDVFHPSKIRK